jgi:hypothetical protein
VVRAGCGWSASGLVCVCAGQIFKEHDTEKTGSLAYDALVPVLVEHPTVVEYVSIVPDRVSSIE